MAFLYAFIKSLSLIFFLLKAIIRYSSGFFTLIIASFLSAFSIFIISIFFACKELFISSIKLIFSFFSFGLSSVISFFPSKISIVFSCIIISGFIIAADFIISSDFFSISAFGFSIGSASSFFLTSSSEKLKYLQNNLLL